MNAGIDTSGASGHEQDRGYLRWLKLASAHELAQEHEMHRRMLVEPWQAEALRRELRARGPK